MTVTPTLTPTPTAAEARADTASGSRLVTRVVRRPLAAVSIVWLVGVATAAIGAHWFAPYNPLLGQLDHILSGPSSQHLLGTDSLGRDVLSRLMYSGGQVLVDALIVVGVVVLLAVPLGVIVGLMRGRLDAVTMRTADLTLSIPGIMILLMVLAFFQHSMVAAMIALGMLSAPALLRIVRSSAIAVSGELYISAARVSGLTQPQIALRHILPRILGPILVQLSLIAAGSVLAASALSYLGVGTPPPAPSWGSMVSDASAVMLQQPWLLVPTGAALIFTVSAFVLLGDAIRDATSEAWAGPSQPATRRERTRNGELRLPSVQPAHEMLGQADDIVRISDLTIAFPSSQSATGWVTVVEGVSFGIARGESIGLVGESGCGKTMTGLALLGLLPAGGRVVAGDIVINSKPASAMSKRERRGLRGSTIAFISQEPMAALDPLFTIGNQIAEAVRTHSQCSRAQAKNRAHELLELVQIQDADRVARLHPFEISGGMAQRVSIAIALAGRPAVLIADEPTTALDVTVQAEIVELLRDIQKETGMAMLLISHDWAVVKELCERAVVMYTGQVVEFGRTENILERPLHPYSEGLLAANPALAQPGGRLQTIPGNVPPPLRWPLSCHFADRCSYTTEICTAEAVLMTEPCPGRLTRCLRSHVLADKHPVAVVAAANSQLSMGDRLAEPDPTSSLTRVTAAHPMLAVTGLVVRYIRKREAEAFNAVDNVDLVVGPGETVGLVGESGSGKSTIGRAVLGLAPVSSGRIHVDGHDVTDLKFKERRQFTALVQAVFQDPYGSLNPALPIRRTLAEPLRVHERLSKTETDRRVEEMIRLVGLSTSACDRYPRDFSGGQRQRIAIARALMMSPRLVICDEPVSSLDLSIQAQILNLLTDLQQSLGLSYLFVSHDLAVVRHVARRVYVIYRGQIMEAGDTETVYRTPSHPYTRALLRGAPIVGRALTLEGGTGQAGVSIESAMAGGGCPYRSRCHFATAICGQVKPQLSTSSTGAASACHHSDEVIAAVE